MYNGYLKKMATAFPCTLLLSDKTKDKNSKKPICLKQSEVSDYRNKLAILLMECIKS